MTLFRRFLYSLTSLLRTRLIKPGDKPYLERYFLCPLPFGGAAYIHRFLADDRDRGWHNHPFNAVSLILSGSYYEEFLQGLAIHTRVRPPGALGVIGANHFHRVTLLPNEDGSKEVWTLFIVTKRSGRWGFIENVEEAKPVENPYSSGTYPGELWRFFPAEEMTDNRPMWDNLPRGRDSEREPQR